MAAPRKTAGMLNFERQADAAFPRRKKPDGWIADKLHTGVSDHHPDDTARPTGVAQHDLLTCAACRGPGLAYVSRAAAGVAVEVGDLLRPEPRVSNSVRHTVMASASLPCSLSTGR